MTFTWWLVPLAWLGIALILAPLIGRWLARRDVWTRCPACGRDLIGYPPEHRDADRMWCAQLIAAQRQRP